MYLNDKKPENIIKPVADSISGRSGNSSNTLQLQDNRPGATARKKQMEAMANGTPVQKKENNTGLPDQLKSGIENLSGHAMDDVKVHYNSDKPAQLNAHAYAQGTNIHVAPGQEKHLPHEAWHVVQQKEGRVQPTAQMKEKININDNIGLEKEADMMGAKAMQLKNNQSVPSSEGFKNAGSLRAGANSPYQRMKWSRGPLDGKETNVDWKTITLGGDQVGVGMEAFPLGPEHLQGGPPKSGVQSKLMNMLPTDPSLSNPDKYIRGHLLNDNLGGPGDSENLFPITGNANKEHERVIESKVKRWVNDDKQWVKYTVDVTPGTVDLPKGVVNSRFVCAAHIWDPHSNTFGNSIAANITSQYKQEHKTDETNAADKGQRAAVGSQAAFYTPELSKSKKTKQAFDEETFEHIGFLFGNPDTAKLLKKLLMEYEGIGQGTIAQLQHIATFSNLSDADKNVLTAMSRVINAVGGNDELKAIIGDVYDEEF
jgi:hypothetical protein